MLISTLAIALSFLAGALDLWRQRIPNAITYGGILAALAINLVGSLLENYGTAGSEVLADWQAKIGWIGFGESLAGLAACGLIMLVCFVFFPVGGGDVKLLAMLGAMLGVQQGLEVLLWTFVMGACAAVVLLIWRVGAWRLVRHCGRQMMSLVRLAQPLPLSPEEKKQLQAPLYLAPCAAVAVILVRFGWGDYLLT